MKITVKKVLKFTLLPGIIPLLRDLFTTGFGQIAAFMAQIYAATRLLPANHPYLNPANQGRFGIRHVVAAAAGNLKFKRENTDQIAVFFLLLTGIVVLFLQFMFLFLSFFMHSAHAGLFPVNMPTSFNGYFGTPTPTAQGEAGTAGNDLAFILLDRVFGVPKVFSDTGGNYTCVETNTPCLQFLNKNATAEGAFPWPFHTALQSVFGFYSDGLLVIAVIIFLYFVIAVAAETAQTGTPFGQRFSKVWAPIRMVVALGLLIPISHGLNSAQYVVLYAAKWGSGFATNGWLLFANEALPRQPGGNTNYVTDNMIATPNPPALTNLLEFNTVLQTCWAANGSMKPGQSTDIQAYFVGDSNNPAARQMITSDTTYDDALSFYKNHNIRIVFGACTATDFTTKKTIDCEDLPADSATSQSSTYALDYAGLPGGVNPICGEVDMRVSGQDDPGTMAIQSDYFNIVRDMWLGSSSGNPANADLEDDDPSILSASPEASMESWGELFVYNALYPGNPKTVPSSADVTALHNGYNQVMAQFIQDGVNAENNANFYDNVEPLGWAGAAIWYNKVVQMNGALVTAADNVPTVAHYPQVMEDIRTARAQSNTSPAGRDAFQPVLANDHTAQLPGYNSVNIGNVLYTAYNLWTDQYPKPSQDFMSDFVINLFGLQGLFNMQTQVNVQPMAQLSMLGKTLLQRGIDAVAIGGAGSLAGGIASYMGYNKTGTVLNQLSTIVVQFSVIAIGAGFLLFYVVPFLPFLYFFFAVGTWIKSVFEAMVGVPLWALAHIRIDGENLPGPTAGAGYLMILEIFLRPILILFGLLAAWIFFSSEVRVLQDIWTLVVSNITGYNMSNVLAANGTPSTTAPVSGQTGALSEFRGAVDQFFYTVIYAIVVYMIGSAAFKLIFLLPNGIIRWLGQGNVKGFNDGGAEIAEGVMSRMQGGVDRATALASNTVSSVGKISQDIQKANQGKAAQKAQQKGP